MSARGNYFYNTEGMSPCCEPPCYKTFLVICVQNLGEADRAAFKFLCRGKVPQSKSDINVLVDDHVYQLIEDLHKQRVMSFTNLTFLKDFLKAVKHQRMLEELEKVEVQIDIGMILECFNMWKKGTGRNLQGLQGNVVRFLVNFSKRKKQKITDIMTRSQAPFADTNALLEFIGHLVHGTIDQQPAASWLMVAALMVMIVEVSSSGLAGESPPDNWFTCELSRGEASESLAAWIIKHGGLRAFCEAVKGNNIEIEVDTVMSAREIGVIEGIKQLATLDEERHFTLASNLAGIYYCSSMDGSSFDAYEDPDDF